MLSPISKNRIKETSIAEFQRNAGQQDVIQWAANFMVNRDTTNPPIRGIDRLRPLLEQFYLETENI